MMEFLDVWYLGAAILMALVVVVALMYEKGWLGGKARLVQLIAEGEHDLATLREKLEAKIAKDAAKSGAPDPVIVVKDKATRIAENTALLAAGAITQADFDAAKAEILTE